MVTIGRTAPKAEGNVFYNARIQAARFNEKFYSREGAAEETTVDRTKLVRIEGGTVTPNPDDVVMMANEYHAPELRDYYCANLCPIGRCAKAVPVEDTNLDRISIKAFAGFAKIKTAKRLLLQITEDGIMDESEIGDMETIIKTLTDVEQVSRELKCFMEKQLMNKEGGY